MEIAKEYYSSRIETLQARQAELTGKTSRLYLVRFVVFVLFVAALILAFSGEHTILYATASVTLLVAFLLTAIYDMRLGREKCDVEHRIKFNQGEIQSLDHIFDFRFDGAEFERFNPHLSGDFDLFGQGSLYQYLNRSVTAAARSRFASELVACRLDCDSIAARGEAIAELSTKQPLAEEFAAIGAQIDEPSGQIDRLMQWVEMEEVPSRMLDVVRIALPVVNILLLILTALGVVPIAIISMLFTISLVVVYLNQALINRSHALLDRSAKILDKYNALILAIEREEFVSEKLKSEQQRLSNSEGSASASIRVLNGLLARFDYRNNVYVSFVLNGLLLFDLQTLSALTKWRSANRAAVGQWLEALTEIDSLMGLGIYAFNSAPSLTYAKAVEGEFSLSAQELSHPLIPLKSRVSNSIEISGRPSVVIITGANMAGKSTMMRTIAVNMILAMCGAPVCAASMRFTPVQILSSIKIRDSLMNRESYFYAELLRLSELLERSSNQPQSMIILDEILRGTNTKDKQLGSIGLLRKIIERRGVALIATHDLIIGRLEDEFPDNVTNYCFEVEIDGDLLSFDYKLKRGISSKLNASLLMRKMGIID